MYKDVCQALRNQTHAKAKLSLSSALLDVVRVHRLCAMHLLFYFYRFPARLSASYLYFQVFAFELYKHQEVTLEMSLFPLKSISVPALPFSLINSIESKSYVFPFRVVFSTL